MVELKTKYFRTEKLFLLYGGNCLDKDEGFLYKTYSIILLLYCNLYLFVVSFDLLSQNFNDAVNGWFYTLNAIYDTSIAVFGYIGRKRLGKIMKKLEQPPFIADIDRGNVEEENKMLNAWSSFFKTQVYAVLSGAFVIISYRLLSSIIKRYFYSERILPWSQITLLNGNSSPTYEILWICQNSVFFYFCFSTIPLVSITIGILSLMNVQFQILHNYLKRILQLSRDSKNADNLSFDVLNSHIKKAVTYHLEIYKMIQDIDGIFNGAFLCVFMITWILICLDIYQASLMPNVNLKQFFLLMEVMTVFTPALVYCYYGEELAHRSEQIGEIAYEIDFVGTDIRFQRSLMIILRQSQKPFRIKAGKMIEGSMAVVVWVLRSSFSAYMMIRTINTPS
ncbi:hypothetical protein FQR65_LT13111 [Abscondita terminalis]|nr:hypothetical protein FQR65_LT13111 [Abscondita terminalis]